MNHDWAMLGIVCTDIAQFKTLRHIEIELDRRQLVIALDCVRDAEVDLRSVESSVARIDLIGFSDRIQNSLESIFGFVPEGVRAYTLFRARGKIDLHIMKSEELLRVQDHLDRLLDLCFDLLGRAENMCVVLAERTNAREACRNT